MKKVLITGKDSYIGIHFRDYLKKYQNEYSVEELDVRNESWKEHDFSKYDVVFHVAGIAHQKETKENANLYYKVNRDLAVEIAKKSKENNIKQFIFMSSMSVYGFNHYKQSINKDTKASPKTNYGKSKLEAENLILKLKDDHFQIAILRPPMVYGEGCKGNYQQLHSFALKSKIFPDYSNKRSMIYIGNLCEFLKNIIDFNKNGMFLPQNSEYICTSEFVKKISEINGKNIKLIKLFNPFIKLLPITIFDKVFGNLVYEKVDIVNKFNFDETLIKTEKTKENTIGSSNHLKLEHLLKHNSFVQFSYRFIMSLVFKIIGLFIKTDESLVLINGHGYKYNDSPRVIYKKMYDLGLNEKYNIIWALNDPEKYSIPGCKKIKMDTLEYFITALRAKYWISCVNIERGLHFKKKNTIYLNTWHGAAINVCGNGVKGRNDFHWEHIDYFCSCGKYDSKYFVRDFNLNKSSLLLCGYPRNDELYVHDSTVQQNMKKKLGLPIDKKAILYAPTWRESDDGGETYKLIPPINWKLWKETLGDEYIILLRTHPYTTELMNIEFNSFVMDFTSYPEVNDLLIASDILISDYSSIILDYSIMCKPIICFGYDYSTYNNLRGFYYDLEKEIPNGVLKNEMEVLNHICNLDYEKECDKTKFFKEKHMEYGGNATIECINKVFKTNY